MPSPFDADDIAGFADIMQELGMPDTGRVWRKAAQPILDEYGYPTATHAPDGSIPCAYTSPTSREERPYTTEVRINGAVILVPLEVRLSNQDTFELTHRFGKELVPPLFFRIDGDPVEQVVAWSLAVQMVAGPPGAS